MQSFELIDLIVFLGISQGIFLAIVIQVLQNKNRLANRTLSLILTIASIMLTGRFFFTIETDNKVFFRLALFVDILVFVFGPLLYLYYRRLIFNEKSKYKLHYTCFIPATGMLAYHFWTYQFSYDEFVLLAQNGNLTLSFLIIEAVGILFNLYFVYQCFQLLGIYQKEEKNNLSYSQNLVRYLNAILIIGSLFLLLWIISFVLGYGFKIYSSFLSYNAIWIVVCVFVYIIGFYSLKQPDLFRMPLYLNTHIKKKERLDNEVVKNLEVMLEKLMINEKIYLNHKLTLVDLAKKLDTSTNNVSWLLNNIHKCTFYDYINTYRVKAFIEKIHNGEHHHHTLLALSMDSGFNSKSTFNKAFKAVIKDTPSNYIKKTA
ncbi:AraC-like DNA-binding protein [Aquimarina sp. MAR_2010_214]|uniref:helix-turn-helix domain-containing protein n=1 Tax=Aquimarina sp. MAR_2010_214 TaxID=1250026 RepID=UPI000C701ACA|nr:helix-turn-helix domain-containing protein [Aquimarina sp. MAR_2010_214]PKV49163.1 AraC-like DNA-binding protein [Aquimarina sp. MAR_2010_214]